MGLCGCFDICACVACWGVVIAIVVVVVVMGSAFAASALAVIRCSVVVELVNSAVGTYHATPLVVVVVVATYDVGNFFVVVVDVSPGTLVGVASNFVAN